MSRSQISIFNVLKKWTEMDGGTRFDDRTEIHINKLCLKTLAVYPKWIQTMSRVPGDLIGTLGGQRDRNRFLTEMCVPPRCRAKNPANGYPRPSPFSGIIELLPEKIP